MVQSSAESAAADPARRSVELAREQPPEPIRRSWLASIGHSKHLGLILLAPAALFVVLFFLIPVFLTGVFGFTNMSTATGITGGAYQASQSSMLALKDRFGLDDIADQLSKIVYTIDEEGLAAAAQGGANAATLAEFRDKFFGQSFDNRRNVERAIKSLDNRPSGTRAIKASWPILNDR